VSELALHVLVVDVEHLLGQHRKGLLRLLASSFVLKGFLDYLSVNYCPQQMKLMLSLLVRHLLCE
jgi:hypothetical protein